MNIVILGAGPAGLCVAWNLVKDGHKVIVLERESYCGGLSATFDRNGYKFDLGPHNIHSKRPSIIDFLKLCLGENLVRHELRPQVYFRRRQINYPLVGAQVLRSLPPITTLLCGLSFVLRRAGMFLNYRSKDDGTYETWVTNRFGKRFYDIFFGPYTEKTWGIPPSRLSDVVAKKRIAIRSISELVSNILFRKEQYHPENVRLISNYYPRNGAGEIADFMVEGIKRNGGNIMTSTSIQGLHFSNGNIRKLMLKRKDNSDTFLDFESEGGIANWHVVSTIPINDLVMMMNGNIPQNVVNSAKFLDFTAEVFLYLNVGCRRVFDVPLLYFSENEFPFNRIYDVGLFSPDMVPNGKNTVCLEITCSKDDRIWNMRQDDVYEMCMGPLRKHNLLLNQDIEDYHIKKITNAYPRFRVGYQKHLRTIFDFIASIGNIYSIGRQGLFSYANIDDALWMGFEIAKEIPYRNRLKLAIEELLPDYVDF